MGLCTTFEDAMLMADEIEFTFDDMDDITGFFTNARVWAGIRYRTDGSHTISEVVRTVILMQ